MLATTTPDIARDAVRSVLDAWIAGVEQENLSLIAQIVAPDEDALFLGSGAAEQIRGWSAVRAALEAQAAAVKDIRVTASDVDIHLLGGGPPGPPRSGRSRAGSATSGSRSRCAAPGSASSATRAGCWCISTNRSAWTTDRSA